LNSRGADCDEQERKKSFLQLSVSSFFLLQFARSGIQIHAHPNIINYEAGEEEKGKRVGMPQSFHD